MEELICSKVKPLKTIVNVWVAATPPILATMGIKIARYTIWSKTSLKILMVIDAMKAVNRFMLNQNTLLLAALPGGAKVSSATPAIPKKF